MSDPDSQKEPTPPPKPPRPYQAPIGPTSTTQSQLLADEQYARQLAHHYHGSDTYRGSVVPGSRGLQDSSDIRARREIGMKSGEDNEDREHSFIDGTFTNLIPPSNLRLTVQMTSQSYVKILKEAFLRRSPKSVAGLPV